MIPRNSQQQAQVMAQLAPFCPMRDDIVFAWPDGLFDELLVDSGARPRYAPLRDILLVPTRGRTLRADKEFTAALCAEICRSAQCRRLGLRRYLWHRLVPRFRRQLDVEAAIEANRVADWIKKHP